MNFYATALAAPEPEEPEQPKPVAVPRATSDFFGCTGWTREAAVRPMFRYETRAEQYEREREELGMPQAPDATAMTGLDEFKRAQWAASQTNSYRSN